jgi:cytosine/adenosine deaminase-related metal-dependent hydrolase
MDDEKSALWIRDPLAILADAAERGIVLQAGRIVELVPAGRNPTTPDLDIFDAGDHVVLPGLINTHHHFYQTLTRAVPAAINRELFPWLQALYPIWAGLTPEALDLGMTLAMAELILSGCTTNRRSATAGFLPTASCRTKTRSSPTASAWWRAITSPAKAPWCKLRWRPARRFR